MDVKQRLGSLDGLRGIFAIIVVISHYFGGQMAWTMYPFRNANIAVDFFFVLSGFVLCHVYEQKIKDGIISDWLFVRHRFFRLYPLHIITMVSTGILHRLSWGHMPYADGEIWSAFANILLIQGMGFNTSWSWNAVSWSISSEFWIGILFLPLIFKKFYTQILIMTSLIGYLLLYRSGAMLHGVQGDAFFLPASVVRTISGVFLGVALCRAGKVLRVYYDNVPKSINIATGFVECAALVFAIYIASLKEIGRTEFYGLAVMPYVILSFYVADSWFKKIIGSSLLKFLGIISFSIYLLGDPCFIFINGLGLYHVGNVYLKLIVFLSILMVTSTLSYLIVEVPIYKKFRNPSSKL